MPGNPQKRQKAAERKAAKRKARERALARATPNRPTSPRGLARAGSHWPFYEARISPGWDDTREAPGITQVVIARVSPRGEVSAAFFLVDRGALGVKGAFTHVFASTTEYHDRLARMSEKTTPLVPVDFDLAAKVVHAGVDYARKLGFAPHRDYLDAARYLDGAHPEASPVDVPLGHRGKPYYVAGPYDNPTRVINQLTKAVGPGNFHVIAPIPPASSLLPEDEDVEDEEDG